MMMMMMTTEALPISSSHFIHYYLLVVCDTWVLHRMYIYCDQNENKKWALHANQIESVYLCVCVFAAAAIATKYSWNFIINLKWSYFDQATPKAETTRWAKANGESVITPRYSYHYNNYRNLLCYDLWNICHFRGIWLPQIK